MALSQSESVLTRSESESWEGPGVRCREDLAIRRPGKHNPGYYRGLYLEIVEERVELENSVAMGH